VKQKAATPPPAPAGVAEPAGKEALPPADKTWPRTVQLDGAPEITVVREDAEKKEFVYRSPHFEFHCDSKLGANVVREFARTFEATWLVNCRLPLDLKPAPEPERTSYLARLFTNRADYIKAGGMEGSSGVYDSDLKAFLVPLESLGVKMAGSRVILAPATNREVFTLIHETTHQMMNRWLAKLPTWYVEGSAEYLAVAKFDNGRFSFIQYDQSMKDYLDNMRSSAGSGPFKMLKVAELMAITGEDWAADLAGEGKGLLNYSSAAVLAYYFYHLDDPGDGSRLIAWLRDVENAADEAAVAAATQKHLVRERSPEQLEKEVTAALRKKGITVEMVPRS
jgi:hypothetical protein